MSLRVVKSLRFQPAPMPNAEIGAPGVLDWVHIGRLVIDERYQREILDNGKKNIFRMIEEFSWALFAPLVVARRREIGGQDRFAIIDGQHRALAAKMHGGIESLPCLILTCGLEQEARAFAAINGQVTRLSNLQVFHARVAAGDAFAKALVDAVSQAGVRIMPYPKQNLGRGETMGLLACERGYRKHGAEVLAAGLSVLMADGDEGLPADAITGTLHLLQALSGAHLASRAKGLEAAVSDRRLKALMIDAGARKMTHGGAVWLNFSAVLNSTAERIARRPANTDKLKRMMAGR